MKIVSTGEMEELLFHPETTPIFGIDTEFDTDRQRRPDKLSKEEKKAYRGVIPTCRARLLGVSIAVYNAAKGFVGAYWNLSDAPKHYWDRFFNKYVKVIFGDESNTVVMHPLKVDMQLFRHRGLKDEHVKCKLECNMALAHLVDENMPKSLKALARNYLGFYGQKTFKQTEKEMKQIRKSWKDTYKVIKKAAWEVYRDHRKYDREPKPNAVPLDPSNPPWQQFVLGLPHKMVQKAVHEELYKKFAEPAIKECEQRATRKFEEYGAMDAILTLRAYAFLRPRLDPSLESTLEIETKTCHPVVTEMEENGLYIDLPLLRAIGAHMSRTITQLSERISQTWGVDVNKDLTTIDAPEFDPELLQAPAEIKEDSDDDKDEIIFNANSTPQVCKVLWDVWQLRPPPYTHRNGQLLPKFARKDGYPQVNAPILEYLSKHAPDPYRSYIKDLLAYRRLTKLKGTYVDSIIARVSIAPDSRLHSCFWPVGTRTTRFSSSDPNAENMPRGSTMPLVDIPPGADPDKPPYGLVKAKKKVGGKIVPAWRIASLRSAFRAPPGWKIVSADLSSIENRLVAHYSMDKTLLKLFRDWDCAACGGHGSTVKALHSCPNCGSGESSRDKAKFEQPPLLTWRCNHCGNKGKTAPAETPHECPKCSGDMTYSGFCLGRDIHSMTAHSVGLVEEYPVFAEARQEAKAVNHAYNYGMGPKTLARRREIPVNKAKKYLGGLDDAYPGVKQVFYKNVERDLLDKGYSVMFDGLRRRSFPHARTFKLAGVASFWDWSKILREATNAMAQGGVGIIMKAAMIWIREICRNHSDPDVRKTKLINQCHDELVYEAPERVAELVLSIVRYCMENVYSIAVPILADGATADTWEEAH